MPKIYSGDLTKMFDISGKKAVIIGGAGGFGSVRQNFRNRVGHGKNNWILCHGFYHFRSQHIWRGNTDKYIGPDDGVSQLSSNVSRVGESQQLLFGRSQLAMGGYDAFAVTD